MPNIPYDVGFLDSSIEVSKNKQYHICLAQRRDLSKSIHDNFLPAKLFSASAYKIRKSENKIY